MPSSSRPRKRSVLIHGHATSITLEDPFWHELVHIAQKQGVSVPALIAHVDASRQDTNLSSALRLFVLDQIKNTS